ncbi:MAG: type II toxin-antitoxin system death-on-curing family toxin [Romboutsia timonensis]
MKNLSIDQIVYIHDRIIEKFGGGSGILNRSNLESAISSINQTFDNKDLYKSDFDKICRLSYNLITSHAFVDGNKRVGVVTLVYLLGLNNIELKIPAEILTDTILDVASSKIDYIEMRGIISNYITPNIKEEDMKLIKESKSSIKETFDKDVIAKRQADYRKFAGLSDDEKITESNLDKWALNAVASRNRCSVEDIKECLFESISLNEDKTVGQAANELNAEVAQGTGGQIESALDRALKVAKRANRRGQRGDYPNVLLVGEAGTGKSSIVRQWARDNGIALMEVRAAGMDATDIGGAIAPNKEGDTVVRLASTEFDKLDRPNSVLFLDEYNRAPREVRTNLLELVNSHVIPDAREEGDQRFLPNFLFTVAAINPPNNRYNTDEMDDAERSRFRTINITFDPNYLNNFLGKRYDRLAADPDNDDEETLEYVRKKTLADKLLTSKKFTFDTPEDMDTGRDRLGEYYKPLNYRSFTLLLDNSDGTKEDLLDLWSDFVNANKKRMAEDILANYVDIDDKANSALKRGSGSDIFKKTVTPWDKIMDMYGDKIDVN